MSLVDCSGQEQESKRTFLAGVNVSLILPNSILRHNKLRNWAPDYKGSNYGEFFDSFSSSDSTTKITVYVEATPSARPEWFFDEKGERRAWIQKNPGLLIKKVKADSITRTIEMDGETDEKGIAHFAKLIVIVGEKRWFKFWFLMPNELKARETIAAIQSSIRIKENYLNAEVRVYPSQDKRR